MSLTILYIADFVAVHMGSLPCLLSALRVRITRSYASEFIDHRGIGGGAAAAAAAAVVAWDSRPIEFLASSDRWAAAVVAASGYVV